MLFTVICKWLNENSGPRLLTGSEVHCSEWGGYIVNAGKDLRLPSALLEEGCMHSPYQVES